MRNKPYYSRSNALFEKRAIREQEEELDNTPTKGKGGSYSDRCDSDLTLKTCNGVKQIRYKERTIENIEWGQK